MIGLKKIINASQMRAADEYTIHTAFHSSWELMEQASLAFVDIITKKNLKSKKITVLCGPGNNGGDGFAVCRILQDRGFNATAILVQFKDQLSTDCEINFKKLNQVEVLHPTDNIPNFNDTDIIIDALLGSGLTGPTKGFVNEIINAVNAAKKKVYSIDVPSGLSSDGFAPKDGVIIADHVVSFQRPKLSFFYPENAKYIKNWETVSIGLSEEFIQNQDSTIFLIDEDVQGFVKPRENHSHKGIYGHSLLIAGSFGKIGAAVLSAHACLRSGVGLLTVYSPKCGYDILQISVPEAMCICDTDADKITNTPNLNAYTSIGIGPGIGTHPATISALEKLIKSYAKPMVFDADAVNGLAIKPEFLKHLPPKSILTPHIKEFDRLVGTSSNTKERIEKQLAFSKKHNCILVLKGANTSISSPEGQLYFNTTGNPGMATGGSGDVLTGIITALLAQNYEPLLASILAVYFHGLAGDKAALTRGQNAVIASDIIENIFIQNVPDLDRIEETKIK